MKAALSLVFNNDKVNDLLLEEMDIEKLDEYVAMNFNSDEEIKNNKRYIENVGTYLYDNEYYLDNDDQGIIKIVCFFGDRKVYLDPIYNYDETELLRYISTLRIIKRIKVNLATQEKISDSLKKDYSYFNMRCISLNVNTKKNAKLLEKIRMTRKNVHFN